MPDSRVPGAAAGVWVLTPDKGPGLAARAAELWRYRQILSFFAGRSVKMLYARTSLGWSWLLIRPLAPLVASVVVYGGLMDVPSQGVPYFLFFLPGAIIWSLFEGPLNWGARGLELNRNLIAKLYFPRMVLPLASMSAGLVEPVVNSGVFVGALFYYLWKDGRWYLPLTSGLLFALPAILVALALAFAIALMVSVWQVRARDVRFAMGYVTGFAFFLTPVIYPVEQVPEPYRWLMYLNPMTSPVETFKWALVGVGSPWLPGLALSGLTALAALGAGAWYFAFMESATADKV